MKLRILALLLILLLLLCGCGGPEGGPDGTAEVPSTAPATALPTQTDPPQTEPTDPLPDAGLAGTVMQVPESAIVIAAEPWVTIPVTIPRTNLAGASAGRLCRLEIYVDNQLQQARDDVLVLPGTTLSFRVDYLFTRYMDKDWSMIRVVLLYGEDVLEKEIPVTLINYPDEVYAAREGSRLPYSIDVIRNHCEIVVYAKDDDGAYTQPVKVFVCSPGYATPMGTFHLSVKNRWQPLFGGVWGQYGSQITGDVLFHSVPYYEAQEDRLKTGEYNRLGSICSMGCIRLCVRDAKWIFDNCPVGTTVNIYDSNTRPFDRPEPIRLDPEDPRSGWDPTDPNENNPWNPLNDTGSETPTQEQLPAQD